MCQGYNSKSREFVSCQCLSVQAGDGQTKQKEMYQLVSVCLSVIFETVAEKEGSVCLSVIYETVGQGRRGRDENERKRK